MFFKTLKKARTYAELEKIRTGRKHVPVRCIKYLCPAPEMTGKSDSLAGYAVILK